LFAATLAPTPLPQIANPPKLAGTNCSCKWHDEIGKVVVHHQRLRAKVNDLVASCGQLFNQMRFEGEAPVICRYSDLPSRFLGLINFHLAYSSEPADMPSTCLCRLGLAYLADEKSRVTSQIPIINKEVLAIYRSGIVKQWRHGESDRYSFHVHERFGSTNRVFVSTDAKKLTGQSLPKYAKVLLC
jgi:hypothetical protein